MVPNYTLTVVLLDQFPNLPRLWALGEKVAEENDPRWVDLFDQCLHLLSTAVDVSDED